MNSILRLLTTLAALAALIALVAAPAPAEPDEHDHGAAVAVEQDHDHEHEGVHEGEGEHTDAVSIAPDVQREFGIVVAPAGPGNIVTTLDLPGEVRPDAGRLAHLVPRFAGIAMRVTADVGDHVDAGDTLAVIESDGSLSEYALVTRLGGTVLDRHLTVGEAASREEMAFVVADLGRVWVDAAVFQSDLPALRVGLPAAVTAGRGGAATAATVSYVAPLVDEATRTGTARLVLDNTDGRWLPGMFVSVRVETAADRVAVAVPETALQTYEGSTVVFTVDGDVFTPRPVTVGRRGGGLVEITAGLAAGEPCVTAGSFTLKAELGKDAFGDGHGH